MAKDLPPTKKLKNGNILTLVEFPYEVEWETFIEFRIEEMNPRGEFLGTIFFSTVESLAVKYLETA